MLNNFYKFELVATKDDSFAWINLSEIEMIVDGVPFNQQDITQITMKSGSKFFIKLPFKQVEEMLLKGQSL